MQHKIYQKSHNSVMWASQLYVQYVYVFILQQDNTQNIKPEGQKGSEALTAARNKKCLEQILATTQLVAQAKQSATGR